MIELTPLERMADASSFFTGNPPSNPNSPVDRCAAQATRASASWPELARIRHRFIERNDRPHEKGCPKE